MCSCQPIHIVGRDVHGRFKKGHPSWIRVVHDKKLVYKIISDLGTFLPLRSSDVYALYNRNHKLPISRRHLLNLLRELEAEGKIKLKVEALKTGGRTTMIVEKT